MYMPQLFNFSCGMTPNLGGALSEILRRWLLRALWQSTRTAAVRIKHVTSASQWQYQVQQVRETKKNVPTPSHDAEQPRIGFFSSSSSSSSSSIGCEVV